MSVRVQVTGFGRAASESLAQAVADAQRAGPLRPVTVIVPSNFAGLTARRLLGAGRVGPGGIANVAFLTPFRLAELLAADLLFDTRPLTNPALGAAVRKALVDDPGPFAPVAAHEATEAALAALYAELSNVSADALDRMAHAGGASAATAVKMFRGIAGHLGGFHGEADLARAAADRPDLAEQLVPFGPIIWYLPSPTTAPMAELIGRVLHAASAASVIVGCTGDDAPDAAVWATCARAGVARPAAVPEPPPVATADRIVSVTDADEEIRAVLRAVVVLAEQGVALDRVGVFFPTPNPYLTIIEEQFAAAGIPANGPSQRRLADSVAGRTLLDALRLPSEDWRRNRVLHLVSGAPVRQRDGFARPSVWEALSRQAGVVAGRADWSRKLDRLRTAVQRRRSEADPVEQAGFVDHLTRQLGDIDELEMFVDDLARALDVLDRADTWSARSEAARSLLHQLLGAGHRHSHWPEPEQDAFERVEDALTRLGALDELEPHADLAVFARALAAELDAPRGRSGRFGQGVTYAPLSSAAGHDLDAVFVVGCIEGLCPSPRREDAMLPDRARSATNGELEPAALRLHDQHRAFLAALAAAPPGNRTLVAPRGDLRGGRTPLPSRWLLDSASARAGSVIYVSDFAGQPASVVEAVPSHARGVLDAASPVSLAERDQAVLLRAARQGDDLFRTDAVDGVTRGIELQRARRSPELTEWDGNLEGQPIPSTADLPISASRLQTWAACGFKYFLAHVLGLHDLEDPEQVIDISARDRGSAVHKVLERFFGEVLDAGAPDPDQPWDAARQARLRELVREVADELEAEGRTGRPLHWRLAREDLFVLLDDFLRQDDAHRRTSRSRPVAVELPFGLEGAEPVVLDLPDGRALRFRGLADRVDQADTGHLLVSDYKTGKGAQYVGIDAGDPVQGGDLLQLGLYAEAARNRFGPDATVEAHYWMVDPRSAYARYGYPWTPERRQRFLEVVTAIVEGIEAGVFPAVPGDWDSFRNTHSSCTYCDFDRVCPRARGEQAVAKVDAPQLRRRDPLTWDGAE